MRYIISGLILIAATALVIWSYLPTENAPQTNEAIATKVNMVEVSKKLTRQNLSAIGILSAKQNVEITPHLTGIIKAIYVEDGEKVQQGQKLLKLDDGYYVSELHSAKALLAQYQAKYSRLKKLSKSGSIDKQSLDNAYTLKETQKAKVEQIQLEENQTLLLAPFSGTLGSINYSLGAYVTSGDQIVRLVNTDSVVVKYNIPGEYFSVLKVGQPVSVVSDAYPNKHFDGKVTFISPIITASTNTITVHALIKNAKHLLTAGMYVQVTQAIGKPIQQLVIPNEALIPILQGFEVYKISSSNRAVAQVVKVGQQTNTEATITSGLKAGDKIITAGQEKLKEGDLVQIEKKSNHSTTMQ